MRHQGLDIWRAGLPILGIQFDIWYPLKDALFYK
jgi:hypothetical protein